MLRKHLLALLVFVALCSTSAVAQKATDTIDTRHFNTALVEKLFLEEINRLRVSKSAPLLERDPILLKAAADQSLYCQKQSVVTHYQQNNTAKYDVGNRVRYYNGNHAIVGENCLMTFLHQPFTNKTTGKLTANYTYAQLAHDMFTEWKNSPGHYQNMIAMPYTNTALAVSLSENKTSVYAVQVFACAMYYPPKNGLRYTDTTYGVQEYDPAKCKGFGDNDYLATIFSSYIYVIEDSIFYYYQNEKTIKEMLRGEKDGMALDLVYKNQFKCNGEDNLHPSTVFDGYMLPPIYRDEFFKRDRYTGNEFFAFVGKIPKNAPRKDLQVNTILIQNGRVCRYSYPVSIEEGILPDIPINPTWCKIEGALIAGKANFVKEFEIPFEKNEKSADKFYFEKLKHLLKVFDGAIRKIEITAYSSVEGTEANNIGLQTARCAFLEKFILDNLKQNPPVEKKAKENWELFFKQLDGSIYESILFDSVQSKMRANINENMDDFIVSQWLFDQRVAAIKIYVEKDYDNSIASNFLPLALFDNLEKGNADQSLIIYTRLINAYKKGEIDKYYLTATEVPLEKKYLPLISNYFASILIESDIFNYAHFNPRYYIYIDSARKLFSDFKPLAFNLAVYKTHLYFRDMLSDVPDFKKIDSEISAFKNDIQVDQQLLDHVFYNYYLTASLFYKRLRMFDDMYRSFEKVKPYLSLASLSEDEVDAIGKYFNYFFRFNETIDLLEQYQKKYSHSSRLTYLYVSTGAIYNTNANHHTDIFYQQLHALANLNRPKLCNWFNENYQMLRDEEFEKIICSYCALE